MNKYATLLLAFFLSLAVHSLGQGNAPGKIRGSVKGKVVDSSATPAANLPDATVSIAPEWDSTETQFAITNKNGEFSFKSLVAGNYRLIISFEGYRHIIKRFSINATSKDLDFATVGMQRVSDMLQEVVVQRPPMSIKKDTVEYNAEMFATKPNAVVEDQLKKLPGVQVDASGTITAQGEKVARVMVNGKRFFGDDPKLATRNLPPDMIEKYQIFDDLDDQSKFSGFDDGNRVKTINIVTKRDRRQGYFGKAIAGGGSDETYNESVNFHRFDNDQQISVLGEANDINKQNFTAQDVLGSSGSRRGSGGGPAAATSQNSPGVTTVWAGGLNYRDNWGPNTEGYGSYFFNYNHVTNKSNSLTQKFFNDNVDTSTTSTRQRTAFQRSSNQRLTFNFEKKFDSTNSLVFRPNISFQRSTPNGFSESYAVDQNGTPISQTVGNTSAQQSGFNINGSNLTLRHRFKAPYRTLSLDLTGTMNVNNGNGYNNSNNNFFRLDSVQFLKQHYYDSLHSVNFSPTISYTEPITRNSIIEFNYNHTYSRSRTVNNTYDYVDAQQNYTHFDSVFSNTYKFVSNSDRFTLNYRIQNKKFNFSAGSGLQFTNYNSLNTTKSIDIVHSYVNITPTVNFRYSFSNMQRLQVFYSGRTGQPSASQLQPLTTTNDSVNFTTGNPNLKPQFTHSIRMMYSSFNPSTQNVLFATINASTITNDIQSALVPNSKNGQNSTYVNLNGTYSVSGYFNYGFALKNPKSNLNLISNINYSQSQTLVYSLQQQEYQHDYSRNTGLSETVSWTTNIKKNFDMNFSSASNYTIARNSLHPTQNLDYFSEVLDAEVTAYTNNGWLIATTFTYTYTNNHTPGFNVSIPLISPSIAKELFRKKNGEIRFSIFDVLGENANVSKTVSLNQVSTSRNLALSRYAMLTFTYNLNNFAPKGGRRRMPGVFPAGGGRFREPGGGGGGGGGFRGGGGGRRGGGMDMDL